MLHFAVTLRVTHVNNSCRPYTALQTLSTKPRGLVFRETFCMNWKTALATRHLTEFDGDFSASFLEFSCRILASGLTWLDLDGEQSSVARLTPQLYMTKRTRRTPQI